MSELESLNDDELLRYNRQIMLPQFDIAGQEALKQACVLIVGAGGLGCPAAMYLVTAGLGRLIIIDDDQVELSNLQRQPLHSDMSLGQNKVDSAADRLRALNPHCMIEPLCQRADEVLLSEHLAHVDLVLDASDNFSTRFLLNRLCVAYEVPLVSAAAIRFDGQLAAFKGYEANLPCYQCLYAPQANEQQNCASNGVLAPIVGVIGTMQALLALKLLAGLPCEFDQLQVFDGLAGSWRQFTIPKDPDCPICNPAN